jgi:hypothetical protein
MHKPMIAFLMLSTFAATAAFATRPADPDSTMRSGPRVDEYARLRHEEIYSRGMEKSVAHLAQEIKLGNAKVEVEVAEVSANDCNMMLRNGGAQRARCSEHREFARLLAGVKPLVFPKAFLLDISRLQAMCIADQVVEYRKALRDPLIRAWYSKSKIGDINIKMSELRRLQSDFNEIDLRFDINELHNASGAEPFQSTGASIADSAKGQREVTLRLALDNQRCKITPAAQIVEQLHIYRKRDEWNALSPDEQKRRTQEAQARQKRIEDANRAAVLRSNEARKREIEKTWKPVLDKLKGEQTSAAEAEDKHAQDASSVNPST